MLKQMKKIISNSKKIEELPFTNYNGMIVYDYYNQPLNFAFTDDNGNYYIGNLFDYDKKNNTDYWVCLPVTPEELALYEDRKLGIIELFNEKLVVGIYIYVENTRTDAPADVYYTGRD